VDLGGDSMELYSGIKNAPVENYFQWAVQNIRKAPNLSDISVAVRNFLPFGNPDMFFNIYIQDGIVKTAIRHYPDYFHKKWEEAFEVGSGKACAIAFDGHWKLYDYKWRYITNEYPHIFWVDNDDKLFVQLWDDVDSRFELAQDVVKVKAIRAWKNVSIALNDHGLVAAYIKNDGKVYYRNYCYQSTGEYVWETEKQITEFTGTAINLNLFITNDYRMGFVIEDSTGKIHLYVTERAWAGMAIAPEKIYANPYEIHLDLQELDYVNGQHEDINLQANPYSIDFELGYTLTDNSFFNIYNVPITSIDENNEEYQDWGKVLIISITNHIENLDLSDLEIVDSRNRTYSANSIERIGVQTYKLEFLELNNFNNVGNVGTLRFKGLYGKNALGEAYEPFEKVFYPQNLVPTEVPIPEVVEVWNE
jgi:hypothetical protein